MSSGDKWEVSTESLEGVIRTFRCQRYAMPVVVFVIVVGATGGGIVPLVVPG